MIVINPQKPQSLTGTVIGKNGTTYRVRTGSGKVITATSSKSWAIGSGVTVLSGEIIGSSGLLRMQKTFQV